MRRLAASRLYAQAMTRGFTLIELMIVLVIIGIIAATAVPMLSQTDTTKLTAAARLLTADLQFAQIESISHGDDPRRVVFDAAAKSYMIAAASDPTTPIINPAGNLPYQTQFGAGRALELSGVTIASYSLGGDNAVEFSMYGGLDQTTPATITLQSGVYAITLTLDPASGEVTIDSSGW